ncbi:MAG TPA: polyprenyl synthetase family protein [Mycobacteriales bacterium]
MTVFASREATFSGLDELPLAPVEDELARRLTAGSAFDDVYAHVLAVPGKRLRARLVLGCAALGEAPLTAWDRRDAVELAAVIEMLHEASLIHDDICDGSTERRGAPSVAAAFGVGRAARAGFHLAGEALRLCADVLDRSDTLRRITPSSRRVGDGGLGALSFGQLLETVAPTGDVASSRRHYGKVARAKTGTMFRLACEMGAAVARCGDAERAALRTFADRLAVAYQIVDDVRDVEGAATLGKRRGTDASRRTLSWPIIEWLATSPTARDRWAAADVAPVALCDDVTASGATVRARREAARVVGEAVDALRVLRPSAATRALADLATRTVGDGR